MSHGPDFVNSILRVSLDIVSDPHISCQLVVNPEADSIQVQFVGKNILPVVTCTSVGRLAMGFLSAAVSDHCPGLDYIRGCKMLII